jgi:hypothetical protein
MKATVTREGWIRDKPIVTRSGIFEYRKSDGKITKEFRSDEEVFKTDSLASLRGIPITNGHNGLVSSSNTSNIIGTVVTCGERQDSNVLAEIVIHNPSALGRNRDLSLGYSCDVDETPGEIEGKQYDCKQINILYNHLATVSKGRAGNAKLRLDSTDAVNGLFELEDNVMPTEPKFSPVRIDEIEYVASPEVINAFTKSKNEFVELKKRFDTIEAERDSLTTKISNHEKEIKAVRESARSELKERIALESIAETHAVKFDGLSDRDLKVSVINKLNPELKLDGKSDDYVDSAFDLTMQSERSKKVSNQIKRMDSGNNTSHTEQVPSSVAARERMLKRIRGEEVKAETAA